MREWDNIVERYSERQTGRWCSYFPEGTRDLIEVTALTLGPNESNLFEEWVSISEIGFYKTRLVWKIERHQEERPIVRLGIGPCGFWMGKIEELPNALK
jgi:hypothetical protein